MNTNSNYSGSQIVAFEARIKAFNEMYKMPIISGLFEAQKRLGDFKSILEEECDEIDQIIPENLVNRNNELIIKTNLSDLLGDIIVYCMSEARRWNIPIGDVLSIIMDSNFSKLDENGNPIYDERGKLLKGPNYWKPEPKIKELLEKQMMQQEQGVDPYMQTK